jgi:transposase
MSEKLYYMGMDVHKRNIAFCVKDDSGEIIREGSVAGMRASIQELLDELDFPWVGAMEATMFTGWIYDELAGEGCAVKVADPSKLEAISSSKKKTDRIDARMIADLLRCDLLPEIHMLDGKTRELRRILRFRNLVVRMAVALKNRISGFLMESGVEHERRRLHGKRYFRELLGSLDDVPESVYELLELTRSGVEIFEGWQKMLLKGLSEHPHISRRVERLMSIPGVGVVTALSWALEMGDPHRFSSVRKAHSYCGLCSALKESAGKERRGPLSKKRNSHIQSVLVEAAKIAPQWNPQLKAVHEREAAKGNRNRATLAVARKLVSYMLSVDKSGIDFEMKEVT